MAEFMNRTAKASGLPESKLDFFFGGGGDTAWSCDRSDWLAVELFKGRITPLGCLLADIYRPIAEQQRSPNRIQPGVLASLN